MTRLAKVLRGVKFIEWAFGTVLMGTITVILTLQYLDGFARWTLLVWLFVFFIATLVKQFDDAGWFNRWK